MDYSILKRGALLILLLFAFAARLSGLTAQSMWRDEVDAIRFAQESLTTLAGYFTQPGWNGPLFYVLLRPWLQIAGHSELGTRYFSLWFGMLGIALMYRLGREWFSRPVGGWAALLMAASPYLVWYAQELKMYALVCTLVLITLIWYRRTLLEGGRWRWVVIWALIWLTISTHIVGALLIPVLAVLFFIWWPATRTQWRPALAVLAGVAVPGIVVAPWIVQFLIRGSGTGHTFVPLPNMVTILLWAFSRGVTAVGGVWPMGLAVFGLLAGTLLWSGSALRSTEKRYVFALWAWLVVPVLCLYAISLRVPLFVDRYLIWIGPALYLLVARGIEQLRRRSAALAVLYLVAICAFNGWGLWQQTFHPIKSDFRAAAAFVRQHRQPGEPILFHISYVRATFEYYYGDSSPYADGIPTDDQTAEASVDTAMRERLAGYDVVWLVLSEPEMWDRRGMTVAWLSQHAQVEQRADFARVSVLQYRVQHTGNKN